MTHGYPRLIPVALGALLVLSSVTSAPAAAVEPTPQPTGATTPTPAPIPTHTATPSAPSASEAPAAASAVAAPTPTAVPSPSPAASPVTDSSADDEADGGILAAGSTAVLSELDSGSPGWSVRSGPATVAAVTTPKTSGTGALKVSYDFRNGTQVQVGPTATAAELRGLPRTVSLDVYGDASWNVVYVQLQDATGEIFHYRLGNASHSGWKTMSVDPGLTAPATTLSGDADGIPDLPMRVYRIVVDKNPGGTKVTSSLIFDRLMLDYEGWSPLAVDTSTFVPSAGQGTTARIGLVEAGTFTVTLIDELGKQRTWRGTAGGGGIESAFRWNGRDDAGAVMRGAVRARLTIARAENTWRYEMPYFAGLAARSEPSIPGSIAGINSTMTQQSTAKRAVAENQARLMEDAWIRMARESFDWNRLEPRKGWFEWSAFDQTVEVARAHNIGIVGILGYSAGWASSAPSSAPAADRQFYAPRSNADFAAYARAVVNRYKDRVKVWEIWNEPNLATFWKPAPSATAYTAMLKAAYAAIKAEDPRATVLIGGLAAADLAFLKGISAAGGWSSFDAVAIHTYVAPQPESSMIPSWLANTKAYVASKGAKPIWITELGWSTYSGSGSTYIGVSEAKQAEYTARSYLMAAEAGVRGIFAYNLVELGTSTTSKLHNYGVVEGNGRQKAAYRAIRRVAEALDQATTAGRADPNAASRVTASSLDSTTGWTVAALGGGSGRLSRATNVRHAGAASIRLDYAFTASSSGVELRRNLTLSSAPTSVSVWVHGDGSANPVYMKLVDKTGESFQGSIGTLGSGWQRMTLYADGADINWKRSGGDNDGVFDYPIKVQSLFVFRGGIGRLSGTVYFDDLQANFGPRVRGTVISRRNGNVQALYTLGPAVTLAVPVPGTNAWLVDGASSPRVTISGGKASVGLGRMPINLLATVGASSSTIAPGERTTLTWISGDQTVATLQILDMRTGAVVRNVWVSQSFDAGKRSATWDGRIAGSQAPRGTYRVRLAIHGPDGRVSYLFTTVAVD